MTPNTSDQHATGATSTLWRTGLVAGLLVVAIGGAAILSRQALQHSSAPTVLPAPQAITPLSRSIPRDVMLFVSLDVSKLKRTPLAALIGSGAVASIEEARKICAFDPLETLSEIGFMIPLAGSAGDFGIAASGNLSQVEVLACTDKILALRQGKARISSLGSFRTARDGSSNQAGELAVRDGGPVMIGAGTFLRTMVDTADGALPTIAENSVHSALRNAVGANAILVGSAILTEEQRAVVRAEAQIQASEETNSLQAIMAAAVGVQLVDRRALFHGVFLVDQGRSEEVIATVRSALGRRAPGMRDRVRFVAEGSSAHFYFEVNLDELVAWSNSLTLVP